MSVLDRAPRTLATLATELVIGYTATAMLLTRLKYTGRVLVVQRRRFGHCRKPVALYATPRWAAQAVDQATSTSFAHTHA